LEPAPMVLVTDQSPDPNSNWTRPFTYGQSPYMNENEPTPRNSVLFASQSVPQTPDPDVEPDRSPQSDDTVHIPSPAS
jgi:hypothetical protein